MPDAQQNIVSGIVFLGCWVTRCSATFGLNNTPTTVEMDLVPGSALYPEDVARAATGFDYVNAEPGKMSGLTIGNFKFVGIIQSWQESFSSNGVSFNVRLADPRILFPNVPLVLNGQGLSTGTQVDNYFNVFSHYGNPVDADSTNDGMTFRKIRDFLTTTGNLNCYGHKLQLVFSSGFQNGSGVVNPSGIPHWYRINANQASLDQVIQQAATDLGMDYYVEIDPTGYNPTGISPTYIKSIPRVYASDTTAMNTMLTNVQNSGVLLSYNRGQELRTEPTTAIVQGPELTYWTTPETSDIQNVWGRSNDGTLITTEYTDPSGIVTLDHITGSGSEFITNLVSVPSILVQKVAGANIYPPEVTRFFTLQNISGYKCGPLVMRAALYSQESWEAMLYKENPTFAFQIGIKRQRVRDQTNLINQSSEIIAALRLSIVGTGITDRTDIQESVVKAVYDATRSVVDENYGRNWLVRLGFSDWFIEDTFDSSELLPRIEFEPAAAAWSESTYGSPSGATSNHPNLQIATCPLMKDDVGKLRSFLSIPNYTTSVSPEFPYPLDLSLFTRDLVFIETQGSKLVVPIQVEAYDKDPQRAIVTPSVTLEGLTGASGYMDKTYHYNFLIAMGYTSSNIRKYNLLENSDDGKNLGLVNPRPYSLPVSNDVHGFFIALKSNVNRFGGFIVSGSIAGGCKLVEDGSLGPWTYGSYANFDAAGQQIAQRSVAVATTIDSADYVLAGFPLFNLGEAITTSAYITAMSIQFGEAGVNTAYQLKTFALPAIRVTKLLTDRISNIYNEVKHTQKQIVDLSRELKYTGPQKNVNTSERIEDALKQSELPDFNYNISIVVPSLDGVYNPSGNTMWTP